MGIEDISPLHERLDLGEARRPEYGPIWLDIRSRSVQLEGSNERMVMPAQEYQVLWLLVRAQGNNVSEADLSRFLYDDDEKDMPIGNTISVYVARVREKLKNLTGGKVSIESDHGMGYKIQAN